MLKTALCIAILTGAIATQASAQVIAQWNFESLTLPTSAPGSTPPTPTSGSYSADVGTGTVSASHAAATTAWSTPSGNGTAKSFSSTNWAVGDYYQFQVSTTGFTNINVGFMQTSSNTGPSSFTLQYSTNGTTFTDFITYSVPATTATPPQTIGWAPTSYKAASTIYFNLGGITTIENVPTVYFRLTDSSAVSINGGTVATAGTGRVDQFTVSQGFVDIAPVPEPGTVALVGLGLGAVLFGVRRKRA